MTILVCSHNNNFKQIFELNKNFLSANMLSNKPSCIWFYQEPISNCYNFSRPFKYSSNEFIVANSSKFKEMPFIIHKFNCSENNWNRIKILTTKEEDPSNLILFLQGKESCYVQSCRFDPVIMDHHGNNNVEYDFKNKKFYAMDNGNQGIWEVDLSSIPGQQHLIEFSKSLSLNDTTNPYSHVTMSFNQVINPYLIFHNKLGYILDPMPGNRYALSLNNGQIAGLYFVFFSNKIQNCSFFFFICFVIYK